MKTYAGTSALEEDTIRLETFGIQVKEGNTVTRQISPVGHAETPCVMFSKTSMNNVTGFSGIFLTIFLTISYRISFKTSFRKAWKVIEEVREVTEKTDTNSDTKLPCD